MSQIYTGCICAESSDLEILGTSVFAECRSASKQFSTEQDRESCVYMSYVMLYYTVSCEFFFAGVATPAVRPRDAIAFPVLRTAGAGVTRKSRDFQIPPFSR